MAGWRLAAGCQPAPQERRSDETELVVAGMDGGGVWAEV